MLKKYSDLIILSIIWIVSIFSVICVILYPYEIGIQNYIGYGLLIGLSVLRYFRVKRFRTILGIVLVFGSFNAIQFTYFKMSFSFSWDPRGHNFSIVMQPLSFLLLMFLIIINFSDFLRLIINLLSEDPKFAADRQKRIVEKHYNELKNEKDEMLNDIIANKGMYQIDYITAAREEC